MATTEEVETLKARLAQRRIDAIMAATDVPDGQQLPYPRRVFASMLYLASKSLSDSWRAEADSYEGSKKHAESAKVRQGLRDAAAHLMGFAGGLLSEDFLRHLDTMDSDDSDPERVAEPTLMTVENSIEALQQHVDAQAAAAANCTHPRERLSALKSGVLRCTLCGSDIQPDEPDPTAAGIAFLSGASDVMPDSFGPPTPGPLRPQELPLFTDPAGNVLNYIPTQAQPATVGATTGNLAEPSGSASVAVGTSAIATIESAPVPLVFLDPAPTVQRLSWEQFSAAVASLPAEQGTSFSKLEAAADCGMKYALDRMARHDIAGLPEPVPAWWEVGGRAFHRAVESIERSIMTGQALESDNGIWREAFNATIVETEQSSGTANGTWRVNSKGENIDWWTVQGPKMVERYIDYRSADWRRSHSILVLPDGRPALELDVELQVGDWPFRAIIDQAWLTPAGIEIIDLKSGATKPPSTFQLGGYAHALRAEFIRTANSVDHPHLLSGKPIAGAFWDARSGSHDKQVADLIARHPFAELVFRARAHHALVTTGAYLPRVSNLPGGCTYCTRRAVCPAQVN